MDTAMAARTHAAAADMDRVVHRVRTDAERMPEGRAGPTAPRPSAEAPPAGQWTTSGIQMQVGLATLATAAVAGGSPRGPQAALLASIHEECLISLERASEQGRDCTLRPAN